MLNTRGFVSWGMFAPNSSPDQRVNLFSSWGLSSSLAAPSIVTGIKRVFLNIWSMWTGAVRSRGY
jgi:hypothetical protein